MENMEETIEESVLGYTARTHKDRLFRRIFGAEDERSARWRLELYNALSGANHTNPKELEITTLEDVIYIKMKNDISFLVDSQMSLWEHQSTLNPNMPLRGLFYFAFLYQKYLVQNDVALFSTNLVKIPAPHYIVFYNGNEETCDLSKLRLSDAFAGGRYVLLDFWGIGCGPCRMAEAEMNDFYEKIKDKLEIVGISADDFSQWKEHEFSKRIAWKNWNDGMKGLNIVSSYCDVHAMPYYVLLSPDKRIVWKAMGYVPGYFMGMYDALNGLPQDNTSNLALVVTKVEADANATKVSFRYYTLKEYPFAVARQSYLAANGKRYKVTAADGITLDERTFVKVKAHTATEGTLANIYYSDFTLTFEPFDTKPATFDFREGDGEDVFVIRNISL